MVAIKFLFLTWDDLYWQTAKLAEIIEKAGYRPDLIVGIARGGWIIARLLSDFLGIDNVASMRIEFYSTIGETREEPRITQPVSTDVAELRVLLADDVADTGGSLRVALNHLKEQKAKEVKIAVVHKKPWCKIEPDFYVRVVDAWIIYPHEYKETIRELAKKMMIKGGKTTTEFKEELKRIGFPPQVINYFLPKVLKDLGISRDNPSKR